VLVPGSPLAPVPSCQRQVTRSQAQLLRTGFRLEHDTLPEGPPPLDSFIPASKTPNLQADAPSTAASTTRITTTSSTAPKRNQARPQPFRTEPDSFGRYRVYSSKPLTIPDAGTPANSQLTSANPLNPMRSTEPTTAPCPNISTFYVQRHHWLDGNNKSLSSRESLCQDVLLQPDFNPRDVAGVNFRALDSKLAEAASNWNLACPASEGWKDISLPIQIPPPRQTAAELRRTGGPPPISYVNVEGLQAHKPLDMLKRGFSVNNSATFHYEPFEAYWKPPTSASGRPQELKGEIYMSHAMRRAHREVQGLKISDSLCTLPRCAGMYMFFSDGAQLASFSNAKAWVIYCQFGNESKYERCKPTSGASFHLAHIPTVSGSHVFLLIFPIFMSISFSCRIV
jgi:hypothetical protein